MLLFYSYIKKLRPNVKRIHHFTSVVLFRNLICKKFYQSVQTTTFYFYILAHIKQTRYSVLALGR